MDIRRVATGHDSDGKAVFVSDEQVPPLTLSLMPGMEFHRLWGSDTTVTFPDSGSRPKGERYFPPVGGFRFGFFTIPPDRDAAIPADLDLGAGRTAVAITGGGYHTCAIFDNGKVRCWGEGGQGQLEIGRAHV